VRRFFFRLSYVAGSFLRFDKSFDIKVSTASMTNWVIEPSRTPGVF
jgi:hypothetical protein